MKQKLLKTMLLLCTLLVGGVSNVWADDPDVDYSFSSFTSAATVTLTPDDDITIKLQKNSGSSNPAWSSSQARVYAKGSMVISSKNYNIAKIVYTYVVNANKSGVKPTIDGVTGKEATGTWNSSTKTWTGSATEVTFSTSGSAGNVGFTKVEITYEAAPEVTSLSIKTAPTKVRYEVGETLDMTGFVLDADDADVTSGYTMTMGGAAIANGATLSSAGKKTITVAYGGKEVEQNISVGTVTGIEITTPPTKTSYDTGDFFDPTGMVVTASLSTGEPSEPDTWTKAVTGYTYLPDEALKPSDDEVYVFYADKDDAIAITVTDVAVTGVSVKASTTIEKTKTETLTPTFTPDNATNKTVTWESDNTSVATVSAAGVVTGVAAGTANITVTTDDGGYEAICVVTVVNEKGTIDAPFSVAEVIAGTATGTGKYFVGYIVGSYNATAPKTGADRENSNLALADSYDETDGAKTIPVQLSKDTDPRTYFNVVDHPQFMGVAKVTIKADVATYFSVNGLKNTDEISKVAEAVKVTAAGYATWASDSPLDFTDKGIKAYIVTSSSGSAVTLSAVNKVPANTGILLKYSGGTTENIPVFDGTGADAVTGNKLKVSDGSVTGGEGIYALANKTHGVGFYLVSDKLTIASGKVYLDLSGSPVKEFLDFDFGGDNETAIESLTPALSEGKGYVYDLSGRRVQKPTKGLYIVNGKKIMF